MKALMVAAAVLASAALIAACGSGGSSAPVESASDSGEAALFGTKGVEIRVVNLTSRTMYVWDRRGGQVKTINKDGDAYFQGEHSGADDVELAVSWQNTGEVGLEMDASNPSVGYPNISFYPLKSADGCGFKGLDVHEATICSTTVDGQSTTFGAWRDKDSSDFKRFAVYVCPYEMKRYSYGNAPFGCA